MTTDCRHILDIFTPSSDFKCNSALNQTNITNDSLDPTAELKTMLYTYVGLEFVCPYEILKRQLRFLINIVRLFYYF